MKTKELSKQVRDSLVEKYKSGLGLKKTSKSLMISGSTIKSIITKWKDHGTTSNLPRDGRPPKLTDRARRALIREALQRPKELQSFTAETGVSVHRTTISHTLHRVRLYGRMTRGKPLLSAKNKKARCQFAKRHVGESQNVWRKVLWSEETKIFGHQKNAMSGANPTHHITQRTPSCCGDVFQQPGLGNWSGWRERWMVLNTGIFLSKTCTTLCVI